VGKFIRNKFEVLKTNTMNALTTKIVFSLDSNLKETATIEQDCNGLWGFTTTRGYNSWEVLPYKSFDKAYSALKTYEKNELINLKFN